MMAPDPFQFVVVGLARPGLDVALTLPYSTNQFWGIYAHTGGLLHNSGVPKAWDGMQCFHKGDVVGLLLDCGAVTLTVKNNGERLGVAATGLTGELC